MIVANRRNLLNGNSFIFGVSGSGKSLMAKQEIISIILSDNNADVILIDPEREYYPLVNAMNGEAIKGLRRRFKPRIGKMRIYFISVRTAYRLRDRSEAAFYYRPLYG